jgi:hypothetical protein
MFDHTPLEKPQGYGGVLNWYLVMFTMLVLSLQNVFTGSLWRTAWLCQMSFIQQFIPTTLERSSHRTRKPNTIPVSTGLYDIVLLVNSDVEDDIIYVGCRHRGFKVGSLMIGPEDKENYYLQPGHPLHPLSKKGGRFGVSTVDNMYAFCGDNVAAICVYVTPDVQRRRRMGTSRRIWLFERRRSSKTEETRKEGCSKEIRNPHELISCLMGSIVSSLSPLCSLCKVKNLYDVKRFLYSVVFSNNCPREIDVS